MKILLIGEWFSDNLGDAVICYCTEYIIKSLDKTIVCERADLSCRGKEYELNIIENLYYKTLRYVMRFLKKRKIFFLDNLYINNLGKKQKVKRFLHSKQYDCVIFCGGQLFMDYFYYQVKYYMDEIGNNTPVIFNSIGNGMNIHSKMLNNYLTLLNRKNVKYISFRDGWEFILYLMNNKKFKNKPFKNYDAALLTKDAYDITLNKRKKIREIGIGVISIDSVKDKEIINKNKILITKLIADGYRIHIFTNGDSKDYEVAQKLYSNFYKSNNICLSICPKSDKELVKLLSEYDFIFSYRLHSHIIAYSLGIPSISITWDKKVSDFFNVINREQYNVSLDTEVKELYNKFKLFCEDKLDNNTQIGKYKTIIYESFSKYISVVKNNNVK